MNTTKNTKIRNIFIRTLCFAAVTLAASAGILANSHESPTAEGTKFALIVGINEYPGDGKLKGAVNDAIKMQDLLVSKYGFDKSNTTLMTDLMATRANILQALEDYRAKASAGDLFVFHNSSHGSLYPDLMSEIQDETQKMLVPFYFDRAIAWDNALVPVDAGESTSGKPWGNLILDDELYEIFASFTEKGIKVVAIIDACNSGSLARGAKPTARTRNLPLNKIFGVKKFEDIKFSFPTPPKVARKTASMNGLYLVLAAAKDNEFALDIESEEPMGLFTKNLIELLSRPKAEDMSYRQLMDTLSRRVSDISLDYQNDQNPQLDSRFGNPFDKVFSTQ